MFVYFQFRREALQKLNQIMSADFVNSNHWSILRENLHSVMSDPDEHLSVSFEFYIILHLIFHCFLYNNSLNTFHFMVLWHQTCKGSFRIHCCHYIGNFFQ